ncbi:MAG TPA: BatD family protein, partial [Prolixibacteraceae bacterium]|nr:BatD family protein [Prolixibacteraceae bacterium]HOS00164.1 BatD family protein [Prolixibacteraceae bacterium]
MLKKVILYIGVLLVGFQSQAQDIRLVMSAPNAVAAGDQFRLTFNINERGENLTLPDLGNFDVLMGPSFSSSTSFQIINGKTTQSRDFSYTYILRAREAGTFTIRPGSIEVDGKVYQSNSLTIQVVTGQSQAAPAQQQGQQQGQQQ